MEKDLVKRYFENKGQVLKTFTEKHPEDYAEIVEAVVKAISGYDVGLPDLPDPERIHQIDDGDYQGTLVFVIAGGGYQPDDYWYVKVSYGSCSGCDTLQSISNYSHETPSEEQIADYMTLALHIVQGLKKMGEDTV